YIRAYPLGAVTRLAPLFIRLFLGRLCFIIQNNKFFEPCFGVVMSTEKLNQIEELLPELSMEEQLLLMERLVNNLRSVRNGGERLKDSKSLIGQLLRDYPLSQSITLEEVRAAASGIKGSMSDTVVQEREDRV